MQRTESFLKSFSAATGSLANHLPAIASLCVYTADSTGAYRQCLAGIARAAQVRGQLNLTGYYRRRAIPPATPRQCRSNATLDVV
jgi:hypothetical protein